MEVFADIQETTRGYLIVLDSRGDVIGPLSRKELVAIFEALREWFSDTGLRALLGDIDE